MRRILLSAAAVAILAGTPAIAADMPVKAPREAYFNWTGFYLGIDGGYGWGQHDRVTASGFANDYNSKGWLVGGHAGYQFQAGHFVLGVEGDVHGADIKGDDAGVGGTTDETRARVLASLRGRLGLAYHHFLLYGTAGIAWGDMRHTNSSGSTIVPTVETSHGETGWTVGGGVQWAVTPHWSIGAEYRHYDLGSYFANPGGVVIPFSVDNRFNTVTGRITYRFGGPLFAKY